MWQEESLVDFLVCFIILTWQVEGINKYTLILAFMNALYLKRLSLLLSKKILES